MLSTGSGGGWKYFCTRVVAARVHKQFGGTQMPPERVQMMAQHMYNSVHQQLMGRMHPAGDAAAIETIILSKRAEEMGMVASDRAVSDLLRELAGDAFSQLRDIIAELKPDGRVAISQSYLIDGLQREILASKYSEMFRLGMLGTPPGQRRDYFEQLNLKADAQVLPVKVEQFVKAVPDPSDEKLKSFFERYKNQLPQPLSPEPGFKEPLKIAFQYFKANMDKAIDRASAEVTPEEMHEYYEKHKDIQFRQRSLPPGKEPDATAPDGSKEDPLGPDEPQPEKTSPAGSATPDTEDGKPADDDTSTEPDSTPAAKPTQPAPPAKPPAPKNPPRRRAKNRRVSSRAGCQSVPTDRRRGRRKRCSGKAGGRPAGRRRQAGSRSGRRCGCGQHRNRRAVR